jgi:glycosyltransferase involved in cell wall biosynthesis
MSHSDILISVIIPAYNYAATLRRAVSSVVKQMNHKHELIVIDDGSTDATPSVVAQIEEEMPGQVRFIRKENGGPSSARNLGIRESLGTYLIFLDADDELFPSALQVLERHITDHPGSRFIIGGHIAISPDGKQREHIPDFLPEIPEERLRSYLLGKRISLCNGACAMHREIFSRADYPEKFRSAEDIPVFAQALASHSCTLLPQALALIHKHADSLRHQFSLAKTGGLNLVDEVFSEQRLGPEFKHLKSPYFVQRSLSLFRSAFVAKDYTSAKEFYRIALQRDWRVLLKFPYTKKALRLWFRN